MKSRKRPTIEQRLTPCVGCHYPLSQVHHILPVAEFGGTDMTLNLCGNCHELYHLVERAELPNGDAARRMLARLSSQWDDEGRDLIRRLRAGYLAAQQHVRDHVELNVAGYLAKGTYKGKVSAIYWRLREARRCARMIGELTNHVVGSFDDAMGAARFAFVEGEAPGQGGRLYQSILWTATILFAELIAKLEAGPKAKSIRCSHPMHYRQGKFVAHPSCDSCKGTGMSPRRKSRRRMDPMMKAIVDELRPQ